MYIYIVKYIPVYYLSLVLKASPEFEGNGKFPTPRGYTIHIFTVYPSEMLLSDTCYKTFNIREIH